MRTKVKALSVLFAITCLVTPVVAADANVYVVHGIPGVDVDVYVNGGAEPFLPSFSFKTIAGPVALPAGEYEIAIYPEGADPEAADPALSGIASIVDDQTVALVAHLSEGGDLTLTPFGIDPRPTSSSGSRLGVRHTADAPPVDVIVSGRSPFQVVRTLLSISNGAGAAANVPALPYGVNLAPAGVEETLFEESLELTLEPGKAYYVYAVGSLAGGTFDFIFQILEPGTEGRPSISLRPTQADPSGRIERILERRSNRRR